MSYLDLPRLCFSGKFQADVSTSNNDPGHFSPELVLNPWWNKMGSHFFQFDGCTIRFVVDLFDAQAPLPGFVPNPNFTWGRVSGAIGPAKATDPRNFVVGRFLRIPPAPPQPMMAAAASAKTGMAEADAAPPAPPPP